MVDVNGTQKKADANILVNKEGRTVVPLRFITELLGWNVAWGSDKATITLTKAG
ncbi:stalk domain-containing protein [Paenibacillus terrae]